jgi:hypothetical protein
MNGRGRNDRVFRNMTDGPPSGAKLGIAPKTLRILAPIEVGKSELVTALMAIESLEPSGVRSRSARARLSTFSGLVRVSGTLR